MKSFLSFCLTFFAVVEFAAMACTSAIIGSNATLNGCPILWKHRDSGFEQNFVEYVAPTDSTFGYAALFNGGDSLLIEAWIGVNDKAFAIMNTASYNLAPDTAAYKDREGVIISRALQCCSSVDDFAALLDTLPRPLGVQANFGVIDATGCGAFFETDDYKYTRYDLQPDSILIRTNFSESGTCGEGLGRVRYTSACRLLTSEIGTLSPQFLTDTVSRSFYRPDLGNDARLLGLKRIEDLDFIPRRSTSASIAIELTPDGPIMWTILGYPPLSKAQAIKLNSIPEDMRPTLSGARSPLSDHNVKLRRKIITKAPDGKFYVNLPLLPNE